MISIILHEKLHFPRPWPRKTYEIPWHLVAFPQRGPQRWNWMDFTRISWISWNSDDFHENLWNLLKIQDLAFLRCHCRNATRCRRILWVLWGRGRGKCNFHVNLWKSCKFWWFSAKMLNPATFYTFGAQNNKKTYKIPWHLVAFPLRSASAPEFNENYEFHCDFHHFHGIVMRIANSYGMLGILRLLLIPSTQNL